METSSCQLARGSLSADSWRGWTAFVVLALGLRGAAVWLGQDELARDPDAYRRTAEALVAQGVYAPDELASQAAGRLVPGAYRPPLYPILLAAIGATNPAAAGRIGAVQAALGLATALLAVVLARRWGAGRWAWLAGAIVAADPLLLAGTAQVMTETLAALLAIAALVAADRALTAASPRRTWLWAVATGIVAGLAILCRPTFLPWAVALPVLVTLSDAPKNARRRWSAALACAGGLLIAICPWTVRNLISLGTPLVTTTHGGYTFYLANNRELFAWLRGPRETAWNADAFNRAWRAERAQALGPGPWPRGTERAADRLAYRRALNGISADPAGFARAIGARVGRFWGLVPEKLSPEESRLRVVGRWAVGLWYLLVLPLTAWGGWRLTAAATGQAGGASPSLARLAPTLWLLASFTAVHAVYWTNLRMRAPLMPAAAVLAAAGMGLHADRKRLSGLGLRSLRRAAEAP